MEYKIEDLLTITQGRLLARGFETASGISVDSRQTQEGDIFFCLKGNNVDGHDFVGDAVKKGAAAIVVAQERRDLEMPKNIAVIEVVDPFEAMRSLSAYSRFKLTCPVVGVTGSNGKTTTKEMIASILSKAAGDPKQVLKSDRNQNTDIGIALTFGRMRPPYRFCVLEMAMRGLGEIQRLAEVARPVIGAVTNIGPAHIELLGSLDNIGRAKGELLQALPQDGHAVYPIEEEKRFEKMVSHVLPKNRWSFGASPQAKVRITGIKKIGHGTGFELEFLGQKIDFVLPLAGRCHAHNAACAAAVALALGVSSHHIREGLEDVVLPGQRTKTYELGGRWILDDCYNANPASMREAVQTVSELAEGGKFFAILGDMLELGAEGPAYHREIGAYAASLGMEGIVGVGPLSAHILAGAESSQPHGRLKTCEAQSHEEAADVIASWSEPGDWILAKASRGIQLEKALGRLKEKFK